jgi:hypothetical protein
MNKGRSFSFYADKAMIQEIKKEMAHTGLRDYAELVKILVWEALQKRKKQRKERLEEVKRRK